MVMLDVFLKSRPVGPLYKKPIRGFADLVFGILPRPDSKADGTELTRERPDFNGTKNKQLMHTKWRRGKDVQVLFFHLKTWEAWRP